MEAGALRRWHVLGAHRTGPPRLAAERQAIPARRRSEIGGADRRIVARGGKRADGTGRQAGPRRAALARARALFDERARQPLARNRARRGTIPRARARHGSSAPAARHASRPRASPSAETASRAVRRRGRRRGRRNVRRARRGRAGSSGRADRACAVAGFRRGGEHTPAALAVEAEHDDFGDAGQRSPALVVVGEKAAERRRGPRPAAASAISAIGGHARRRLTSGSARRPR